MGQRRARGLRPGGGPAADVRAAPGAPSRSRWGGGREGAGRCSSRRFRWAVRRGPGSRGGPFRRWWGWRRRTTVSSRCPRLAASARAGPAVGVARRRCPARGPANGSGWTWGAPASWPLDRRCAGTLSPSSSASARPTPTWTLTRWAPAPPLPLPASGPLPPPPRPLRARSPPAPLRVRCGWCPLPLWRLPRRPPAWRERGARRRREGRQERLCCRGESLPEECCLMSAVVRSSWVRECKTAHRYSRQHSVVCTFV